MEDPEYNSTCSYDMSVLVYVMAPHSELPAPSLLVIYVVSASNAQQQNNTA